jgi:hypothetical protein
LFHHTIDDIPGHFVDNLTFELNRNVTKFRRGLRSRNDKTTAGVFDTLSLESEQWFRSQPSTAKGGARYRKQISLECI